MRCFRRRYLVVNHINIITREKGVKAANQSLILIGGRTLVRPNLLESPLPSGVHLFIPELKYGGSGQKSYNCRGLRHQQGAGAGGGCHVTKVPNRK
jgi:hypothetical protein